MQVVNLLKIGVFDFGSLVIDRIIYVCVVEVILKASSDDFTRRGARSVYTDSFRKASQ